MVSKAEKSHEAQDVFCRVSNLTGQHKQQGQKMNNAERTSHVSCHDHVKKAVWEKNMAHCQAPDRFSMRCPMPRIK